MTERLLTALLSMTLYISASAQTTSPPISEAKLAAISASKKVPKLCIAQIQKDGALDFKDDEFCPIYLILASHQFLNAEKTALSTSVVGYRGQLQALVTDPAKQQAVVNKVLADYKTLSQQQGASSGTSGTTSLVAKGAASEVLSLASEYGAVTETTSGQTTTVSGSLAGLPLVLMDKGLLQSCAADLYDLFRTKICGSSTLISFLNQVSYSVSFNTSSNSQTVTGTATGASAGSAIPATFLSSSSPSINAASAKWIVRQGKPAANAITSAVATYQATSVPATAVALSRYFGMNESASFLTWVRTKRPNLIAHDSSAKGTEEAVSEWLALADEYVLNLSGQASRAAPTPEQNIFLEKAAAFAIAYAQSLGEELTVGLAIARPAVLTVEYDANLPSSQPSNSVIRGIYQAKAGGWTLTANGAISLYNSRPSNQIVGSSRLRDFQFAAEADHDFSISLPTGKVGITGSGAFYDQDQTSPAILNVTPGTPVNGVTFTGLPSTATQVYAQKGNIAVGQFRLSIGSGSNIHVPLSVTYSNRTELVNKPVWRGQIGIAYDLDSLFQSK
jgi:hypothetical protein